jgi:hypothetical protein
VKRHHLSSHYEYARELLKQEMFNAHNKFLEKVCYGFSGEIVNTYTNEDQSVGMTIKEFDKKNKGNEYGKTIDNLDFILIHFSNRDKQTISNCKKLLKLYTKYEWPLTRGNLECSDSVGSDETYLPILVITWADGVEENYKYMEELCNLVANCVDDANAFI